jgi:hypothetical protein
MRILRKARSADLTVGLVLLGIVAFAISAYVAMVTPPLYGPDEAAHAAYAMALLDGDLPTIDTPMIDDPARFPQVSATLANRDDAHRDVWTANHPPLYYAMSAPLLAVADSWHQPGAGLLGMRLLNGLGMALSVVLVGLIARELVPGRPAVALLATVLATACGTALALGGQIFNDGPGNAAASLTLLAAARMLTCGPSRGRIVVAAIAGTAAVGFRAPGMVAVALCAAAAGYAVLSRPGPRSVRRWLAATGAAAIAGGVPALCFGWFYLRNIRLYGDLGATRALLEKFDREPRATSLVEVAFDPDAYVRQFRGLFLRAVNPPELSPAPVALLALALLGLLLTALPTARTQRRWTLGPGLTLAWVMLLTHAVLIEYSIWSFFVDGGNRHVRYAFPILPLLLTLVAVGLLGLVARIPDRPAARLDLLGTMVFSAFLFVVTFALHLQGAGEHRLERGPFLSGHTVGPVGYGTALAIGVAAAIAFLVWLSQHTSIQRRHDEVRADGLDGSVGVPDLSGHDELRQPDRARLAP